MPRSSLSDVSSSDNSTSSSSSRHTTPTRKSPRRKIRIPRRYSSASASTSTSSSISTPCSPSPCTPLSLSTLDTAHITAHHLATADDLLVRVFDEPRNRLRVGTIGKQTDHANHMSYCNFTTSFYAAFKNQSNSTRLHQRAQEFTQRIQEQGLIDRDATTASAFANLSFRYAKLKYHSSRVKMGYGIINTKMQARIVATAAIPRGVLIHELDGLMSGDSVDLEEECATRSAANGHQGETSNKRKRKREPQYNMFSIIQKSPRQCGPAHADRLLVGPARFVNHACKPNCRLKPFRKTNAWGIETLTDISADEEITVSYGKAYFGPGECGCASCQEVQKDTELLDTADMDTSSEEGAASSNNDGVIEKRTRTRTRTAPVQCPTPPADSAELEDSARPRKRTRTRY